MERKRLNHLGFDMHVCAVLAFLMIPLVAETAPLQEFTEVQQYTEGCYYNYNHYNEGDRIMTNEPCLNCTCHNKMLMCYLRVCPFTKPIGHDCIVEKREDQCCPIITCPEVPVDVAHHLTETDTQLHVPEKYGCNLNGKFYPEGAQVPSNPTTPCELCYCIKNRTSCLMQECTLHIEGCMPIYNRGSCCPIRYNCDHENDVLDLEDNYSTTFITTQQTTERPTPGFILTTTAMSATSTKCVQNDQFYIDGSRVPGENPCQNCYCMRGDIICAVQECKSSLLATNGKICMATPANESECCSNNYVCEDDVTTYQNLNTSTLPYSNLDEKVGDISSIPIEDLHSSISEDDIRLQAHIDKHESNEIHRDKFAIAEYERTEYLEPLTEFLATDNPMQRTTYSDNKYFTSEAIDTSDIQTKSSTKTNEKEKDPHTPTEEAAIKKNIFVKNEKEGAESDIEELINESAGSKDYITNEKTNTFTTEAPNSYRKDEISDSNMTTELSTTTHSVSTGHESTSIDLDNSGNHPTSMIAKSYELTTTPLVSYKRENADHIKDGDIQEQFTKAPEFEEKLEIKNLKADKTEFETPYYFKHETQTKSLDSDEIFDDIAFTDNEFEPVTEPVNNRKSLNVEEFFVQTNPPSEGNNDVVSTKAIEIPHIEHELTEIDTTSPTVYDRQTLSNYDKNIGNMVLTNEESVVSLNNTTVRPLILDFTPDASSKSQYLESDNQVTDILEELLTNESDTEANKDEQTNPHITKSTVVQQPGFINIEQHNEFTEYTSEVPFLTGAPKFITESTIFKTVIQQINNGSFVSTPDESILPSPNDGKSVSSKTKNVEVDAIGETTPRSGDTPQYYSNEGKTTSDYGFQSEGERFSEASTNDEKFSSASQTTEGIINENQENFAVTSFTNVGERSTENKQIFGMLLTKSEIETATQLSNTGIDQITNPSIGDNKSDIAKEHTQTILYEPIELNEKISSYYTPSQDFTEESTQANISNTTTLENIAENTTRTSEKLDFALTTPVSDEKVTERLESTRKITTYVRPTKTMVIEEQPKKIIQQYPVAETTTSISESVATEYQGADVLTKDSDPQHKDKQTEYFEYEEYESTEKPLEEDQSRKIEKESEKVTDKTEGVISSMQPLEAVSVLHSSANGATEISDYESVGYSDEPFNALNDEKYLTTTEEWPSDVPKKSEFGIFEETNKFISTEPSRVSQNNQRPGGEIGTTTTEANVDNQSDHFFRNHSVNFKISESDIDDEPETIATDKSMLAKTSSTLPTLLLKMFDNNEGFSSVIENNDHRTQETIREPLESTDEQMLTKDVTTPTENATNFIDQYTTAIILLQKPAQNYEKMENATSNVKTITPHFALGEMSDVHLPPTIPGEGSCLIDQKTYGNNAVVPISDKCEISCKCVNSVVICDRMHCNIPTNVDRCIIDEDKSDKCCPNYICDTTTFPPKMHYITESIENYKNYIGLSEPTSNKESFIVDKTDNNFNTFERLSTVVADDNVFIIQSTKESSTQESGLAEEIEGITRTTSTSADVENKYPVSRISTHKPSEEYEKNENESGLLDVLLNQANATTEIWGFVPTSDQLTTLASVEDPNSDLFKNEKDIVTTENISVMKPSGLSLSTLDANITNTENQYVTDSSGYFVNSEIQANTNIFKTERLSTNDIRLENSTSDNYLTNSTTQHLGLSEKNNGDEGTTTLRTLENPELITLRTRFIDTSQEVLEVNTYPVTEILETASFSSEGGKEEISTTIPTTIFLPSNEKNPTLDEKEFHSTKPTDKSFVDSEETSSEQEDLYTQKEFFTSAHIPFTDETFTESDEYVIPQKIISDPPTNALNNTVIDQYTEIAEKMFAAVNTEENDQTSLNEIIENDLIEDGGLAIGTTHSTIEFPALKVVSEQISEPSSTLISVSDGPTTHNNFKIGDITIYKSNVEEFSTPAELYTMFESENMVTAQPGYAMNVLKEEPNGTSLLQNEFVPNVDPFLSPTTQPITEYIGLVNNLSTSEENEKKDLYMNSEFATRAVFEKEQYPLKVTVEPNIKVIHFEDNGKNFDLNETLIEYAAEGNDQINVKENNPSLSTITSNFKSGPDYTTERDTQITDSTEMNTKLTRITENIAHVENEESFVGSPIQISENLYDVSAITTTKNNILTENIKKNITSIGPDERTDQSAYSSTIYPLLSYHIATDKLSEIFEQNTNKEEEQSPHSTERISTKSSSEILTTTTTTATPVITTTLLTTQYPQQPAIYGQQPQYPSYTEDEYTDEDETEIFGPGTCRYGGKLYVSAQQIPRDDPCDFCFCFRSDIICLQQSCPPPISGCHEEPISGFCCPRYECPVSMATVLNVTTSTTTTSTTLPPHFLHHSYGNTVQRIGCLINGRSYRVGDKIESTSGPCINCTCGGDGKMKCDPQACVPEPTMQEVMAVVAASHKR
uniref:VWFC domain-containing protein n=1 Tax=Glossina pallidipes TaxID=7398 RepID=A0A1A9ZDU0_GLOPL